jgi:hypothetical protein
MSRIFLNRPLQADNICPTVSILNTAEVTGLPVKKGLEQAVISNGKIVNICSNQYALLANETFFGKVEQSLQAAGFEYDMRAINRDDSSFAVDYILKGDSYKFELKGEKGDVIRPFLRFTNSYDKSTRTGGHFGYFRQVCSNGLHVAQNSEINFAIKHRGYMAAVVLPSLDLLLYQFMNNDFFNVYRQFEALNDIHIDNPTEAVRQVLERTATWKHEASDKNDRPGLNSRLAIETIEREAATLGTAATAWLVYNALQEVVHEKLHLPFQKQEEKDRALFAAVTDIFN